MQHFHILVFFLFAISHEVLGQSRPVQACPEPSVQANFTLQRFLGRWYEIFTSGGVQSSRCITSDFTASNRTLRGYGTQNLIDGSWRKDVNNIGQFSVEEPAKIKYTVNGGLAWNYQEFFVNWYVLETDYDNYAIIWRCISNNATADNEENAWILGRTPELSPTTINYLDERLRIYGIEDMPFVMSPQGRYCTYPNCI